MGAMPPQPLRMLPLRMTPPFEMLPLRAIPPVEMLPLRAIPPQPPFEMLRMMTLFQMLPQMGGSGGVPPYSSPAFYSNLSPQQGYHYRFAHLYPGDFSRAKLSFRLVNLILTHKGVFDYTPLLYVDIIIMALFFCNMLCSVYSDNTKFYKPHTLAASIGSTVRNSRAVARRT